MQSARVYDVLKAPTSVKGNINVEMGVFLWYRAWNNKAMCSHCGTVYLICFYFQVGNDLLNKLDILF